MYNSGSGRYSTPNGQPTSRTSWSADPNRPTGYPATNYPSANQQPNTQPLYGQNHSSHNTPHHPARVPPQRPSSASNVLVSQSSNQISTNNPQSKGAIHGVGLSEHDGVREPPKDFSELSSMSLADLRLLNSDQSKFNDFVSNHEYSKSLKDVVTKLQLDLNELERSHAASSSAGNDVSDKDIEELQHTNEELEQEVAALREQQTDWMERNSPERLMERLRMAMKESADAAEYLERSFISKTLTVDEFLEQYIECRKTYHERSQKLEKLKQEAKRKTYGR